MHDFQDAPLVGPGSELQLTLDGGAVPHEQVVAEAVLEPSAGVASFSVVELGEEAEALELDLAFARASAREENLYVAGERLAARAASPATRKQYASIYRTFGDWLRAELDRPPTTSDLTGDAIGAFGRHLEQTGGRGGGPAAPATRRVYLNMVRALARDLGLAEEADRVRVPRHRAGPPETLTDVDYANLLRVPDQRSVIGKRDVALLRVLGDCGLRSAELRGLTAGDLRRPRSNARHSRLFVRGKGGVEREVDVPAETQAALDTWLAVHPLGVCLATEQKRGSSVSGSTRWTGSDERPVHRPSSCGVSMGSAFGDRAAMRTASATTNRKPSTARRKASWSGNATTERCTCNAPQRRMSRQTANLVPRRESRRRGRTYPVRLSCR